MILAVVSHKGGVGKTTTAVHLAAYFQTLGSTLLLDGDDTRNAINWSQRGAGFPFRVAPVREAAQLMPTFTHTVIDTGQRQTKKGTSRHVFLSPNLTEGCGTPAR